MPDAVFSGTTPFDARLGDVGHGDVIGVGLCANLNSKIRMGNIMKAGV